jgi:hypothetical protein
MAVSNDLHLTTFLRFFSRLDKNDDSISWLKDRARAKALVESILTSPLFAGIARGRAEDDDFTSVTLTQAVGLATTGRELLLEYNDRDDDGELSIALDLRDGLSTIQLEVSGALLASHAATAIDELIAIVQGCVRALAGAAGLSDGRIQCHYAGRAFEFPRPRPPRENGRYPERSVVAFIDPAFHATTAAFAPPPPSPAVMSESDGLVTVRWSDSIDDAALVTGASEHVQWIVDRIDTDQQFGFNDLGDQIDDLSGAKPRAPLTLYDAEYAIGYKAVVVLPDGTFEEDAWSQAKQVALARVLPDGTTVEAVRIIVPLRELALAVGAQAKAAGIDAVLYADGPGNFWNPDPPGLWRTPPRPATPAKSPGSQRKS